MKEYIDFPSSGAAYDACNSRDEMVTGRIFTVEAEQIVGISWAWPIAVTVEHGQLHTVKRDPRLWTVAPKGGFEEPEIAAAVKEALQLAQSKGWDIAAVYDLTM
jgi:hypothetical protein